MQDTSSPQVLSLTKKGTRRWISRVQLLWNRRHFLTKRSDEETTWQRDNCNSTWVCKCNLQLYMAQWVVILPERASLFSFNVLFKLNRTPHKLSLWLYYRLWQILISYCKFIMPKALKWITLGLCISIFH